MIELTHDFPAVSCSGRRLYGGNQTLSSDRTMRGFGCGVIAGLDLLVYLCRYHGCRAEKLDELVRADPIPWTTYDRCAQWLNRRFLPLIPGHGINGISLAVGLNAFFLRNGLRCRAKWGVSRDSFWPSMERMLWQDIPVILSIGPNFPRFWQHNTLPFYQKNANGQYAKATSICSHYVTVTGMDETWLQISSWGRKFYISRREYEDYIHAHSLRLVSNILVLEHK